MPSWPGYSISARVYGDTCSVSDIKAACEWSLRCLATWPDTTTLWPALCTRRSSRGFPTSYYRARSPCYLCWPPHRLHSASSRNWLYLTFPRFAAETEYPNDPDDGRSCSHRSAMWITVLSADLVVWRFLKRGWRRWPIRRCESAPPANRDRSVDYNLGLDSTLV